VQVIQAPVAAAPASNPATAASDPARLLIDAIGLDYPLVPVGLDANRVPIVLDHDIAWYKYSARPTQGENVVFWAHVLRFRSAPNKPAPFERLRELAIGARVSVITADGTAHPYAITQQIWAKPEQVEYILPQGREMVTMVSCIGDAVISNGAVTDMSHRLITIAEPVR
jgi:sortase (surface protein transpeptidase)